MADVRVLCSLWLTKWCAYWCVTCATTGHKMVEAQEQPRPNSPSQIPWHGDWWTLAKIQICVAKDGMPLAIQSLQKQPKTGSTESQFPPSNFIKPDKRQPLHELTGRSSSFLDDNREVVQWGPQQGWASPCHSSSPRWHFQKRCCETWSEEVKLSGS